MLTSRIRVRVCGSGLRGRGTVVVGGAGEWSRKGGGCVGEGRGACGRGKKSRGFSGGGCHRRLLVCRIFLMLVLLLLLWS